MGLERIGRRLLRVGEDRDQRSRLYKERGRGASVEKEDGPHSGPYDGGVEGEGVVSL